MLVVGPAGAGKTTAMRPAVAHLHAEGRPCFGVAPSAAAADVLAADTGIDADTLLVEHHLDRPPTHRYDLPRGATVVVDEAAMVPTARLAELFHLADQKGWRLALIGDPMQFSAVGRSGMFGLLVDAIGAVELDRVHRFDASWERDASLRLRRGDTDAVAIYDRHGRLRGGTPNQMAAACVAAWRHATLAGHSAAMMAPTRQGAALLNQLAQAARLATGELDPTGPSVRLGDTRAYTGDLVATRRNDRTLRTDRGHMVKNRDHWTITHIGRDGSLNLTGPTGHLLLPADYATADVELAYAETSHATQGRTVDRSFLYLDSPTDTAGIYVPLTRGRTSNEAFVVLHDERTAAEVVADDVAHAWIDQPATASRQDQQVPPASSHARETEPPSPEPGEPPWTESSSPATATWERLKVLSTAELRILVAEAVQQRRTASALDRALTDATTHLFANAQELRRTERDLANTESRLAWATRTLDEHDHPFRRRGHRDQIQRARSEARSLPGVLANLDDQRQRLAEATAHTRAAQHQAAQRKTEHDQRAVQPITASLAADAHARGEHAARRERAEMTTLLGAVPDNPEARDRWIEAAGRVAQHEAISEATERRAFGQAEQAMSSETNAFTRQAAEQAIAALDSARRHELTIETDPPSLSL